MERAIKKKDDNSRCGSAMPQDLINAKPPVSLKISLQVHNYLNLWIKQIVI